MKSEIETHSGVKIMSDEKVDLDTEVKNRDGKVEVWKMDCSHELKKWNGKKWIKYHGIWAPKWLKYNKLSTATLK